MSVLLQVYTDTQFFSALQPLDRVSKIITVCHNIGMGIIPVSYPSKIALLVPGVISKSSAFTIIEFN